MRNNSSEFEHNLLKIIIVGDTSVGKSSMLTRFFDKKFSAMVMTVGII